MTAHRYVTGTTWYNTTEGIQKGLLHFVRASFYFCIKVYISKFINFKISLHLYFCIYCLHLCKFSFAKFLMVFLSFAGGRRSFSWGRRSQRSPKSPMRTTSIVSRVSQFSSFSMVSESSGVPLGFQGRILQDTSDYRRG